MSEIIEAVEKLDEVAKEMAHTLTEVNGLLADKWPQVQRKLDLIGRQMQQSLLLISYLHKEVLERQEEIEQLAKRLDSQNQPD